MNNKEKMNEIRDEMEEVREEDLEYRGGILCIKGVYRPTPGE